MNKKILTTACFFGLTAIIFGALGAHGLKNSLTTDQLNSFKTGTEYQMYHALFLLFVAQTNYIVEKTKKMVFFLTFFGVLFFSFSIYLLSTMSITHINFKPIGFVTPIGGILLIMAWIILTIKIVQHKNSATTTL